jgi:AcrR family transcriptional regulator
MTLLIFNRGRENEGGNWQNGRRGASRLVVQRAPAPGSSAGAVFSALPGANAAKYVGIPAVSSAQLHSWYSGKCSKIPPAKVTPANACLRSRNRPCSPRALPRPSIEELIAAAGISKSGFFYHFKDKGELAKAMMLRYIEQDTKLLDDIFARADELNDDPLHGLLSRAQAVRRNAGQPARGASGLSGRFVFVIRTSCSTRASAISTPGASCAGARQFRARLDAVAERYPPRRDIDLEAARRHGGVQCRRRAHSRARAERPEHRVAPDFALSRAHSRNLRAADAALTLRRIGIH